MLQQLNDEWTKLHTTRATVLHKMKRTYKTELEIILKEEKLNAGVHLELSDDLCNELWISNVLCVFEIEKQWWTKQNLRTQKRRRQIDTAQDFIFFIIESLNQKHKKIFKKNQIIYYLFLWYKNEWLTNLQLWKIMFIVEMAISTLLQQPLTPVPSEKIIHGLKQN